MKTLLMLVGLAAFTGASAACFGLFDRGGERRPVTPVESCEWLVGQAKIDCEKQKAPEQR